MTENKPHNEYESATGGSRVIADTEQQILDAAEAELMEKGYDGVRTTAIAQRAGVTHAMLHYYFGTKEKLCRRVIANKVTEMRQVMFGFISEDDGNPFMERVRRGVEAHFDFIAANPDLPAFMLGEIRRHPELMDQSMAYTRETADSIREGLQRAIDENAARGVCRRVDATMLVMDIICLNIFVFIGVPLIGKILSQSDMSALLANRRKENVEVILSRLRP